MKAPFEKGRDYCIWRVFIYENSLAIIITILLFFITIKSNYCLKVLLLWISMNFSRFLLLSNWKPLKKPKKAQKKTKKKPTELVFNWKTLIFFQTWLYRLQTNQPTNQPTNQQKRVGSSPQSPICSSLYLCNLMIWTSSI